MDSLILWSVAIWGGNPGLWTSDQLVRDNHINGFMPDQLIDTKYLIDDITNCKDCAKLAIITACKEQGKQKKKGGNLIIIDVKCKANLFQTLHINKLITQYVPFRVRNNRIIKFIMCNNLCWPSMDDKFIYHPIIESKEARKDTDLNSLPHVGQIHTASSMLSKFNVLICGQ